MMAAPERMGTAPRAIELLDLPDELIDRVFKQVSSVRDLGRAGCVCRAWRAGDSPVVRVLRQRIEAHGGEISAALPPVAAASATHRLCLLDSVGAAQAASGVISTGHEASAAVDVDGRLCVWGDFCPDYFEGGCDWIISCDEPTVVPTAPLERVSVRPKPHSCADGSWRRALVRRGRGRAARPRRW